MSRPLCPHCSPCLTESLACTPVCPSYTHRPHTGQGFYEELFIFQHVQEPCGTGQVCPTEQMDRQPVNDAGTPCWSTLQSTTPSGFKQDRGAQLHYQSFGQTGYPKYTCSFSPIPKLESNSGMPKATGSTHCKKEHHGLGNMITPFWDNSPTCPTVLLRAAHQQCFICSQSQAYGIIRPLRVPKNLKEKVSLLL